MTPEQMFLLMVLLFGFFLGKKLPTNRNRLKIWIFNRRGIPFYRCHILDGNKIINYQIVAQSETHYTYEEKRYKLTAQEEGQNITPFIQYGGEYLVFHLLNNVAPLSIKDRALKPLWTDPEIVASMITNKDIKDATSGSRDQEITELKRYILIINLILVLAIFGLMYYLLRSGGA
jgi:hypothetical protein